MNSERLVLLTGGMNDDEVEAVNVVLERLDAAAQSPHADAYIRFVCENEAFFEHGTFEQVAVVLGVMEDAGVVRDGERFLLDPDRDLMTVTVDDDLWADPLDPRWG